MIALDRDLVIRLWQYLCARHGARVEPKQGSQLMIAAGALLEKIGVMPADRFARFTTTVGDTIYVPFEIGDESAGWTLYEQVKLIVHELVHRLDFARDPAGFAVRYLADPAYRAEAEARAYATGLALDWWRYGSMPSAESVAACLRAYGCGPDEIASAMVYLESVAATVADGGCTDDLVAEAIAYLEAPQVAP